MNTHMSVFISKTWWNLWTSLWLVLSWRVVLQTFESEQNVMIDSWDLLSVGQAGAWVGTPHRCFTARSLLRGLWLQRTAAAQSGSARMQDSFSYNGSKWRDVRKYFDNHKWALPKDENPWCWPTSEGMLDVQSYKKQLLDTSPQMVNWSC